MPKDAKKQASVILNSTLYVIVTGVLVTVLGQWAIMNIWPPENEADLSEIIEQSPISLARWQEIQHAFANN